MDLLAYARIAGIVAALAGAFGAGWVTNGWRGAAVVKGMQVDALQTAIKERDEAIGERDRLARQLGTIDTTGTAQRTKDQTNENNLRATVAAGAGRLRIAAKCPATPTADGPPAGSGVDSGTAPVLDPSFGQDYFNLRANIRDGENKLSTCQASLRAFTDWAATPAPRP